jgi:hypothetical protein
MGSLLGALSVDMLSDLMAENSEEFSIFIKEILCVPPYEGYRDISYKLTCFIYGQFKELIDGLFEEVENGRACHYKPFEEI